MALFFNCTHLILMSRIFELNNIAALIMRISHSAIFNNYLLKRETLSKFFFLDCPHDVPLPLDTVRGNGRRVLIHSL